MPATNTYLYVVKELLLAQVYTFFLCILDQQPCCCCFNPHLAVFAQLLYIIPRLLPETRGAVGCSAGANEEKKNLTDLWADTTNSSSTWRKTALQLWRHPAFRQRGDTPQYQVAPLSRVKQQENMDRSYICCYCFYLIHFSNVSNLLTV